MFFRHSHRVLANARPGESEAQAPGTRGGRRRGFTIVELIVAMTIQGYPPDLETLVKGVDTNGKKLRFLRHIPTDPMTGKDEWGLRSMQDDPDSDSWGEQNVFDVYTKSEGTGLDGTKYKTW